MSGGRIDLFVIPHKGLRWWMAELSSRLGATDFTDAPATAASLAELSAFLDELDAHSLHEETFIAPFMERRGADRFPAWEAEHRALDVAVAALRRQSAELTQLGTDHPNVAGLGLGLYRAFARFAATTLLHLDEEETTLMPLLWSVCSDADLAGLMDGFRARFSAEAMRLYTRTAPAFTTGERALLGV